MNEPVSLPPENNFVEMTKWLVEPSRKPRDILRLIKEYSPIGYMAHLATNALNVRLSEIAEESAAKMEQQTARLVDYTVQLTRFTQGLFWLTMTLALLAVIQICIAIF